MIAEVLGGRRSWWVETCDVLDGLRAMPAESVHCVVTSPPYPFLRDYGVAGQIGMERTVEEYLEKMVAVFREVRRVMRRDSTLWLNLGSCYWSEPGNGRGGEAVAGGHRSVTGTAPHRSGSPRPRGGGYKPKDLVLVPFLVAEALRQDGFYLRSAITWGKKACMPESVTDRPTSATEMVFLLAKAPRYYYDADAVREPHQKEYDPPTWDERRAAGAWAGNVGVADNYQNNVHGKGLKHDLAHANGRNLRNYWELGPEPYAAAHFATFVTEIPRRAILAGTSAHGVCPECGAPWRRVVERRGRGWNGAKYGERVVAASGGAKTGGTARSTLGSANGKLTGAHETTGWISGCAHGLAPVGAVVLDPFSGASTTGVVALRLGRRFIGLELNPAYVRLSRDRIVMDCPMFNLEEAGG